MTLGLSFVFYLICFGIKDLKIKRRGSKQGIADVIVAAIFILFIMALAYAAFNFTEKQINSTVTGTFGTGIFNPLDDYTFVQSTWQWWLILAVFFPTLIMVWQQAQRRSAGSDV